MAWGIGRSRSRSNYVGGDDYDDDDIVDESDMHENKIVAGVLASLAAAFIGFVIAMPYLDKDGSMRRAITGLGGFGEMQGRGAGLGGGGGGASAGARAQVRPNGLGPIEMGMSAEEVRKMGPANFYRGAGGRLVANVRERNAAYTAWFTSGEQSGTVSRLRYDRVFPGEPVEAAVDFVTKGLGDPVHSRCTGAAGSGGARECALRWKSKGGVSISARLRQEQDGSGAVRSTISITAVSQGAGAK